MILVAGERLGLETTVLLTGPRNGGVTPLTFQLPLATEEFLESKKKINNSKLVSPRFPK